VTGTVTAVKLRLYTTTASPSVQSVYATVTNPNWIESGTGSITWTNAPTIGSTVYGSAPVPTVNAYNEITLDPSAVSGNGLVTYALKSTGGSNNAVFSSKEAGSNPPQLVITQTVGPTNTPPTANATSATIGEDGSGPVALSGSDPDTGNCELTFSIVTPPSHGTLGSIGNNGCLSGSPNTDSASVTYTPAANYNGADSFTYKVNDGSADSSPATASITITPVNDIPSAGAVSTTASIGTPKTITLTGADVETCNLIFSIVTPPSNGTLGTVTDQACAGTGPFTDSAQVTYTATSGTSDSFTYKVNDGTVDSTSATVTITITAANTLPTANATSATVAEDGSGPVALSGGDAETCDLTFSIVSGPSHGSLGSIGNNACAGSGPFTDSASVTYTPAGNYNGPDSFTYKVNDGSDDSAAATATLTVTSVNDTPTANAVTTSTPQNTPKVITLSGSDVETCDLVFAVTQGTHGSVTPASNNACSGSGPFTDSATVTYTPNNGYTGPDSFTYTVADATATSIPATVSITVNASSSTVTVAPAADAKVGTAAPDTNYGTTTDLRTREENPIATTTYRSYLKFNVPALSGTISSIKLRLFVTSASIDATGVYPVADNSWIESGTGGITWNNAKPIGGTILGSAVAGPAGAYIEISLNPTAIAADGVPHTYSFAIKAAANHSGSYSSKEAGTNPPQVVIVTGP
jgi:VCBS repeat-containing protein